MAEEQANPRMTMVMADHRGA